MDDEKVCPLHLKENVNSPIKFINCTIFPENKTGKCFFPLFGTIEKLHAEIKFVAWQRDLSREVKIVYLFFQGNTSRKFLSLLFFLFSCFSTANIVCICYFAECHGLSCVYVRGSWYTALSRVSLSGVGLRCVGLAQKIFARCKRASNTGSYGFFFSLICIFILSLTLSHLYVFFYSLRFGSRLWKVNIDQKWNLFYHYLFQRTPVIYDLISQESVFLFAIYFR